MHMLANITQQKFHFYSKKIQNCDHSPMLIHTANCKCWKYNRIHIFCCDFNFSSGFRERHKRNIAKVTTARTAPKKKNLHNSLKLNAVKYCMGNMPKIISKQMTA